MLVRWKGAKASSHYVYNLALIPETRQGEVATNKGGGMQDHLRKPRGGK